MIPFTVDILDKILCRGTKPVPCTFKDFKCLIEPSVKFIISGHTDVGHPSGAQLPSPRTINIS